MSAFRIVAGADFSFGVDHAVPWNACIRGQCVQRVSDLPCVSAKIGECRDLTVCRDPTAWNVFHNRIDHLVGHQEAG